MTIPPTSTPSADLAQELARLNQRALVTKSDYDWHRLANAQGETIAELQEQIDLQVPRQALADMKEKLEAQAEVIRGLREQQALDSGNIERMQEAGTRAEVELDRLRRLERSMKMAGEQKMLIEFNEDAVVVVAGLGDRTQNVPYSDHQGDRIAALIAAIEAAGGVG